MICGPLCIGGRSAKRRLDTTPALSKDSLACYHRLLDSGAQRMNRLNPIRLHAALRGGPGIGALSAHRSGSRFGGMPAVPPNFQ